MITAHWIRKNEVSRAPNRWFWFDTESQERERDGDRVQTWRLAVSAGDWLNEKRRTWQTSPCQRHVTAQSLWEALDGFTRPGQRTIAVAHNIGYDIRIGGAIPALRNLGYELKRWQVSDQGCVLRWRRDDRALWLVDSFSWLPKKLEAIASLVQMVKPPLPADDDPLDLWWRRCEYDVEILRAAYLPLVKWVRDENLGNWQPTAGSMAWANWRHRHFTNPVLVHDDDDARHAERSAGYTGRCEAWRHGRLPAGRHTEWDFPLAYPRVCLTTALPTILRGRLISPTARQVLRRDDRNRFLVYAAVDTPTPTLPVHSENRILWPVGSFSGWYWDHELVMAAEHGATIRPETAYRYSASLALAEWAETIIDVVEGTDDRYTPIQRLAAKEWARALIGRFGTRYWQWEDWGSEDGEGVRMDWLIDFDTRNVGRILHVADRIFGATEMVDGVHSVPSVMSAIMSECRIRLWDAIQAAGPENVAYCDTDSVIVNPYGDVLLNIAVWDGKLWGMRRKSEWRKLTVIGPRQLILDDHHRVAGISQGAERVGLTTWVGERWEGLATAAEAGRTSEVVIRPTTWELTGVDRRRRHLEDGTTEAIVLGGA